MKISIGHVLAAMVLLIVAAARPAAGAEGDATVIATLLRFVDALEAGDARTLEQLVSAGDTAAQERSRRIFVDLAVAQKGLEKAALSKFGEEGKKFRCGFDLIVNMADRKTIASAKVSYDDPGRSARIEKTGELAPMLLRRGTDGQWQVVLDPIENEEDPEHFYGPPPYPLSGMMRFTALAAIKANRYNAIVQAFQQTQNRIESGDLPTAAAAQAELMAKLSAADADAVKAKAAVPSGRLKDRP